MTNNLTKHRGSTNIAIGFRAGASGNNNIAFGYYTYNKYKKLKEVLSKL